MNRPSPRSVCFASLKTAALLWLAAVSTGHTMTWYFGYDPPADKRAAIENAMNEAVASYNANGYFDVSVRVIYNSGIPTAQSNYNGELGFGGSISPRVAHHEISHYLGTGTTDQWYGQFGNNVWQGAAAKHFIQLFDGPGANLNQSGQHYYPYGLNYDNEDGLQNRLREVKLVSAMRFDMGGYDANGNGIDDEWERYKVGPTLLLNRDGDADGDGISNFDEWWTEGEPLQAAPIKEGHSYVIRARHSQKVVNVAGGSTANGANVDQLTANGSTSQQWTANYRGGGYWRFINVNSGKVLETAGVSAAPRANIQQWEWLNNDGQQWRTVPSSGNVRYFKIFNKAAMNMTMDVLNGSTDDSADIIQYNDLIGVPNQEYIFEDVTPGLPPAGVQAEYKFDNTTRDSSGSNFHGIATGGITYTAGRVDGLAATFNGTNGSVEIPDPLEADFTITCWVKTTATAGGPQWFDGMGLVDSEVGGVKNDFGLALVGSRIGFGVGNPDTTLLSTTSVNDGAWHHVAAVRNNASGLLRIYIDGALNASATGAAGARNAPNTLRLGSIAGNRGFYNGSLDEVRLYSGVLTPVEISRLAGVANTAVASYQFEGDAQDASGHRNHGNAVGVTYGAGKVGTRAARFDGKSSFVQIPAAVDGDFSVAFWANTTATGGSGSQWYNGQSLVDADIPGAASDWGISLVGNKAAFGVGNTGAGTTVFSTAPINDGLWHHVTAIRNNASGYLRLFVDGVQQGFVFGASTVRDTPGVRVGSTLFGGSFFNGAIDDLRIYNYPLIASQVTALASTLPAGWVSTDVGSPGSDGYAGYSSSNGGVYTVGGGGRDIAGNSDQFQFLGIPVANDQTIITRLLTLPVNLNNTTATGAKAGLMVRNSATATSTFVDVTYEHNVGLRFLYRDTDGATVAQAGGTAAVSVPVWLRLVRSGNAFTASYATTSGTPQASDWIVLGSHDAAMVATPLAGFAVTSRQVDQVATATFGGYTAFASTPGNNWRQDYFGTSANAGDAADNADPDNDGINNLLERALGLNPTASNPASDQQQLSADGTSLILYYPRSRAATDLKYQVVWSKDLQTWSAEGVTDTVLSSNAATEQHEARVPLSLLDPIRSFLRLQVSP